MIDHTSQILVTGGAGFIGSNLVHQLAQTKARVTILDNLVNGKSQNIQALLNEKVQFVQGDVRNLDLVKSLCNNVDVVFHLACLGVRHSLKNPHENHAVNATATLN